MRIPTEFKLQDHLIKVYYVDTLTDEQGRELLGEADYNRNRITLSRYITGRRGRKVKVPSSQQTHTFIHEITHLILIHMGEDRLNNSERFVDLYSGFFHQFLNTKKY